MNSKAIISIVTGTIILFVWSMISWMALPFHGNGFNTIPEDAMDMTQLKKVMPESGIYHYPGIPEDNSEATMKKIEDQLAEGPRITLMAYSTSPSKLMDPKNLIYGFFLNLLTVLLTFFIISKMKLKEKNPILMTCLAIGLILVVISELSMMNWFMFPLKYTIGNIIDHIVSFGILGLLFGYYTFKSEATAA